MKDCRNEKQKYNETNHSWRNLTIHDFKSHSRFSWAIKFALFHYQMRLWASEHVLIPISIPQCAIAHFPSITAKELRKLSNGKNKEQMSQLHLIALLTMESTCRRQSISALRNKANQEQTRPILPKRQITNINLAYLFRQYQRPGEPYVRKFSYNEPFTNWNFHFHRSLWVYTTDVSHFQWGICMNPNAWIWNFQIRKNSLWVGKHTSMVSSSE